MRWVEIRLVIRCSYYYLVRPSLVPLLQALWRDWLIVQWLDCNRGCDSCSALLVESAVCRSVLHHKTETLHHITKQKRCSTSPHNTEALHHLSIKTALHSIKRVLYSIERALYFIKRALYFVKRALYSINRRAFYSISKALIQSQKPSSIKGALYFIKRALHSPIFPPQYARLKRALYSIKPADRKSVV